MKALEKYPQMETQLNETLQALEGVSQEELEWKPVQHEKVRTIGDMMRHIVQAEDTFINRFVMGQGCATAHTANQSHHGKPGERF